MAKCIALLSLVLCPFFAVIGQTNQLPDSLWRVKNYLIELQSKLPQTGSGVIKKELVSLDSLISLGNIHRVIFKNQLEMAAGENDIEPAGLLREYDLILQAFILFKTDLKQDDFRFTESSLSEAQFITEKIPILVDKIYYLGWLYEHK